MTARSQPRSDGMSRLVAACSALPGPFAVWMYESGRIDWFGSTTLFNVWVVVAFAVCGIAVGAYAAVRGARVMGAGSVILNLGVAALYGFLGLFFGLGGSR